MKKEQEIIEIEQYEVKDGDVQPRHTRTVIYTILTIGFAIIVAFTLVCVVYFFS